ANAQASHSPLIVTAGQQVRSTVGVEPLLTNVDAGQLPRPLVKWSYEPASAQDVPRAFAQALSTAMLPPRGPVYLSIPYDDWTASVPEGLEVILARKVSGESALPDAVIATLLRRLASARSPLLVLGAEVDAAAGQGDAVLLAEKQNLPVWIAPSPGRCPVPTEHPNFRGVLTAGVASLARELHEHDLVLVIGAPVFRYHQFEPGQFLGRRDDIAPSDIGSGGSCASADWRGVRCRHRPNAASDRGAECKNGAASSKGSCKDRVCSRE
ncbi:MAG TPA: hypothetical protein VK757_04290, partial [Candidatus Acidoferrum sp.]|nr:hypothetical protein [Candidatus Acidoferrum sp.]